MTLNMLQVQRMWLANLTDLYVNTYGFYGKYIYVIKLKVRCHIFYNLILIQQTINGVTHPNNPYKILPRWELIFLAYLLLIFEESVNTQAITERFLGTSEW